MKQVRVNIRTAVNSATIRKEKRGGRDVIVVPSATMPDGVQMNGIVYPAEAIEASYKTLDRTPAPLGHPMVNGQFVSASDPEGLARGWIGAWNENVRREGGRVLLDKVIDVAVANQLEGGRRVIEAINAGKPIHTSTGLLCNLDPVEGVEGIRANARNIMFDHDAILLDEPGAATPEQGVGMLVNGQHIEVINSELAEQADREVDWAVESLVRALDRKAKVPMLERIKATLLQMIGAGEGEEKSDLDMQKEADMADEKQYEALSAQVNEIAKAVKDVVAGLPDMIANAVKPLTDAQAEMVANAKAKDDAERADLAAKVVKANMLSQAAAADMPLTALRELAAKAAPGKAAALNSGGFGGGKDADDWDTYSINSVIDEVKK